MMTDQGLSYLEREMINERDLVAVYGFLLETGGADSDRLLTEFDYTDTQLNAILDELYKRDRIGIARPRYVFVPLSD